MFTRNQALAALFTYIAFHFLLPLKFAFLDGYGSYAFEIVFVAVLLYFARGRFRLWAPVKGPYAIEVSMALIFGMLTLQICNWFAIPNPFDLNDPQLLFFLLIVGPILEELLFRQVLWFVFEDLFKSAKSAWIATAIFFSFGHFYAYLSVPEEFKPFVLYQSIYTLILAFWWGHRYLKYRAYAPVLILHFTYNFGFYLGSKF